MKRLAKLLAPFAPFAAVAAAVLLALSTPVATRAASSPAEMAREARRLLEAGDTAAASRLLERAVELDPASRAARELGLLRGQEGRIRDAFRLLRPWALAHPEDLEARLAAAFVALELGRVPDAGRLLEGLDDADLKVALLRGKHLYLSGEPYAAIELLAPRLAGAPPPVARDVRTILAESYLQVGESRQVVELLAGHAADPWLVLLLGRAHHHAGELDAAVSTLRPIAEGALATADDALRANGLESVAGSLFLEYGRVLLARGDATAALPYLERASVLRADDRQAWQTLGQARVMAGQREAGLAALERFRELVAREGSDSVAREHANARVQDPTGAAVESALRHFRRGEEEAALALLRDEQQLVTDDPRPWLAEIRLLLDAGRAAEAAARVEPFLARFPGPPADAATLVDLAGELRRQGQIDAASALLERVNR